jgi:hypothetical protein
VEAADEVVDALARSGTGLDEGRERPPGSAGSGPVAGNSRLPGAVPWTRRAAVGGTGSPPKTRPRRSCRPGGGRWRPRRPARSAARWEHRGRSCIGDGESGDAHREVEQPPGSHQGERRPHATALGGDVCDEEGEQEQPGGDRRHGPGATASAEPQGHERHREQQQPGTTEPQLSQAVEATAGEVTGGDRHHDDDHHPAGPTYGHQRASRSKPVDVVPRGDEEHCCAVIDRDHMIGPHLGGDQAVDRQTTGSSRWVRRHRENGYHGPGGGAPGLTLGQGASGATGWSRWA